MNEKRYLILSVDDEPANVLITEKILTGSGYDVMTAHSGAEALNLLNKNPHIDLILMDVMMPDTNGYDICRRIKAGGKVFQDIPVIFLTAVNNMEGIAKGFEVGGVDYIIKPFQKIELLARIKTHLKIKSIKDQEIEQTQKELIYMMSQLTDAHSLESAHHIERVSEYSKLFARLLGYDEKHAETFKLAAAMHDIGKIGISDTILNKKGKLTADEITVMQTHTTIGYSTLSKSQRPLLKAAAIVAHQHHEKWDGSGYPRGLKGEEIHILGRITALADVFDALDTKRSYKDRWPLNDIFAFIKTQSGQHFDPQLVELFVDHFGRFIEIRDRYEDTHL
ncbi:MAG: hypothetical protein DRG24_06505 [Epsilonproteobacteria bacterium]|nr:MAG: hypothetical protein DRG24_06505 [Campylobacterota bacterium]